MKIQTTIIIVKDTVEEVAEDKEVVLEDPEAAIEEVTDHILKEAVGNTRMSSMKKKKMMV